MRRSGSGVNGPPKRGSSSTSAQRRVELQHWSSFYGVALLTTGIYYLPSCIKNPRSHRDHRSCLSPLRHIEGHAL